MDTRPIRKLRQGVGLGKSSCSDKRPIWLLAEEALRRAVVSSMGQIVHVM